MKLKILCDIIILVYCLKDGFKFGIYLRYFRYWYLNNKKFFFLVYVDIKVLVMQEILIISDKFVEVDKKYYFFFYIQLVFLICFGFLNYVIEEIFI